MQRPLLAADGQARLHRGDEAFLELAGRCLERRDDGVDDVGAREHVAGHDHVGPDAVVVHTERPRAGVRRALAVQVEHGELAVLDEGPSVDDPVQRGPRVGAPLQRVEQGGAEPRVGHVLGRGATHPRPEMDAAGGHGRARRRDRHPDRAAPVGGQHGEGHAGSPSGITAIASTSTSHSGRASADTTIPVEIGCTPRVQRPIVR